MMQRGKYGSFGILDRTEQEGQDYRKVVEDRRTDIIILAPHGGEMEPGTSEIAQALAGTDFSLYCFESLRGEHGRRLHITSVQFDEPECVALVRQAEIAVAVHGCKGDEAIIYVGGLDDVLIGRLIGVLKDAGFDAREDNSHHAGNSAENICNRGRSGRGVQLELSTGLRRAMFGGSTWWRREATTAVFDRFVDIARSVLLEEQQ
ncbi:MAG: poly-gamma-glutamate hydrolase family protein [Sedimentisphaerales bacterium]|nr:poly-gamma-glutamate hydrolase family protein [Sedimentisphaerales bacterium]